MKKSTFVKVLLYISLVVMIGLSLIFTYNRRLLSITVMSIADAMLSRDSLPNKLGFSASMRLEGMPLYPIMVTFNDDIDMSARLGKDVGFTVEYTFADFNASPRHSDIYLPDAQLFGCYVGIYYLTGIGEQMTEHTAWSVAEFDVVYLAMPAIGLEPSEATFEVIGPEHHTMIHHSGLDWQVLKSPLSISGHNHNKRGFELGYLQFGTPPPSFQNYPVTSMVGVLHYTYLEAIDLNLALFAIAKDSKTLELLEHDILMQVELTAIPK